jgi:demethylmenaquinone methyltransferase/2-methoxy-6-polyprenyl-1,4-benzoquinol methylase
LTQKTAEELSASCLFFLASLLTGLVSVVAFGFVWAKQRAEKQREPQKAAGYLADERKALNFYMIFSVAYDILNPYLYTDAMRREMVNQIENGANLSVLDVGCGTGYTTAGILSRKDISQVIGLDMNPVQLKRAAANLRLEKPRTFISRGDADKLPFVNSSFDAVISVGAIEYFPDPEKTLKELVRVTKPGGTVIVGGPESGWFSKFALNRVFYTPSAQEMETIFHRANLVAVKSHLTGMKTFFGTSRYVVFAVGKKPNFQSLSEKLGKA